MRVNHVRRQHPILGLSRCYQMQSHFPEISWICSKRAARLADNHPTLPFDCLSASSINAAR